MRYHVTATSYCALNYADTTQWSLSIEILNRVTTQPVFYCMDRRNFVITILFYFSSSDGGQCDI